MFLKRLTPSKILHPAALRAGTSPIANCAPLTSKFGLPPAVPVLPFAVIILMSMLPLENCMDVNCPIPPPPSDGFLLLCDTIPTTTIRYGIYATKSNINTKNKGNLKVFLNIQTISSHETFGCDVALSKAPKNNFGSDVVLSESSV